MCKGREDEYGKTLCVLLHCVCVLHIVAISPPPLPPFVGKWRGAGVTNFCMKECCTGWICVGNFALIPSKLYIVTFYKCSCVYQRPVFCP